MAGGSRRYHTKTRNACGQCKKRRVRCDCTGPICCNCRRRGEACDFALRSSPPLSPSSSSSDDQSYRSGEIVFSLSPIPQPSSPDLETLELLHHYETATALTSMIEDDPIMEKAWQYDLPLAAQSHEFLMHGILGLSALHKAHYYPVARLNYYSIALRHQTKASETFRLAVDRISISNSTAVFGVTFVFAIFQFKHCTSMGLPSPNEGIDTICDAISTLRGIVALAFQHNTLFKGTCFGAIPRRVWRMKPKLDENVRQELDVLHAMNLSSDTLPEEKLTCTGAIQQLRDWCTMVRPYPVNWNMVLGWPAMVSAEFIVLLRQRHPMALVIFAHWCVPVHRLKNRWFIEGWAENTVRLIFSTLPVPWKGALGWVTNEMCLQDLH